MMEEDNKEIIGHVEWPEGVTKMTVIIVVCIHGAKYGFAQWYNLSDEDYIKNREYRRVYYPVRTEITKAQAYDIVNGKMMIKLRKSEGGFVNDAELDEYIAKARENIDTVAQRRWQARDKVFKEAEKEKMMDGMRTARGSCRNQLIKDGKGEFHGRNCKECYENSMACQLLVDKIKQGDEKDKETKKIKDDYKKLDLKEKIDIKKGISGLKYVSPKKFHREVKV